MKKTFYFIGICLLLGCSCAKQLTSIQDKSQEQIAASYTIDKDVSYGSDADQRMDIYISNNTKSLGDHNYTVVFLHSGAYYTTDKRDEEKFIEPYLKKGLNVVNMNYRLKRGIPIASSDLTNALNMLKTNNKEYVLNLNNVILTGFSAGGHIAMLVGVSQNNPDFPNTLKSGIKIKGIVDFSGPVDGLGIIEKIFIDNTNSSLSQIGKLFFPLTEGYTPESTLAIYTPITYFDTTDPPIFLWHGAKDDIIPTETFHKFISHLALTKNRVQTSPTGKHAPTDTELSAAYTEIFNFLDGI